MNSLLDTLTTHRPLLLTIPLCAAIATVAALRRRWLTSPNSRRQMRRLEQSLSQVDGGPERFADMTRWLLTHDAFARRSLRRRASRFERLAMKLAGRSAGAALVSIDALIAARTLAHHESQVRPQKRPALSPRAEAALTPVLFAGDIGVTSAALAAHDTSMSLLNSVVVSLVFAVALWSFGKRLGHRIDRSDLPWLAKLGEFLPIAVCATALGQLRPADRFVWSVLSAVPSLASAAVTSLCGSASHKDLRDARRAWATQQRRMRVSLQSVARLASLTAYVRTETTFRGIRFLTSREQAVAAAAGVTNRTPHLYATVSQLLRTFSELGSVASPSVVEDTGRQIVDLVAELWDTAKPAWSPLDDDQRAQHLKAA